MKIIKPSYEILTPINREEILKHLELCGRVCYKSENKITETSAPEFIIKINKLKHHTVLEHFCLSVRFICDRGVSHELVRHRIASYSQESTRYCNYEKELTFIRPYWMSEDNGDWFDVMQCSEVAYQNLLETGYTPQDARAVLPNSLKTEIIVTANLREWLHVFELRCSEKAHPAMRELMIPLQKELQEKLGEIFNGQC